MILTYENLRGLWSGAGFLTEIFILLQDTPFCCRKFSAYP